LREIGREELELAGARTAADIVQFTAGLHLLSSGARGGTAHAQIRGGDPNFSVILLDGVPLNDPTGVQGGAFNLSALPMDQIEQIQILRGPHSYFFGSSALGGVVSFRTTRGSGDHKARTSLEAGSHDLARGAVSSVWERRPRLTPSQTIPTASRACRRVSEDSLRTECGCAS
jgi:outer membrane cobalamin receptor